jgi:hypothetical protein
MRPKLDQQTQPELPLPVVVRLVQSRRQARASWWFGRMKQATGIEPRRRGDAELSPNPQTQKA